jgi:hypothetical protein
MVWEKQLSAGVYRYRLKAGEEVLAGKMTLLKQLSYSSRAGAGACRVAGPIDCIGRILKTCAEKVQTVRN